MSTHVLNLPARSLQLPRAVSEDARAALARAYLGRPQRGAPAHDDVEAWKAFVTERETPLRPLVEMALAAPGATVEERPAADATLYVATPSSRRGGGPVAQYYIHGGGWVLFGGSFTAALAKLTAESFGTTVYAIDYRMPPWHVYPAALDDSLAGYREVLKAHASGEILVSGGSAGGNIAAAMMLRAHDEGLPRPGALFLDTPAVDLTALGDSLYTNQGIDSVIGIEDLNGGRLYAGDTDLSHPYLSPLNGDLSHGFPPTYLRTGTRDLLLSDTVRMHAKLRKAGVDADLYVVEGMPHGGFDGLGLSTPEDQDARADLLRWLGRHF